LDQFLIQIEWGNKNFIFNLIKLPYLPRLVLHPSQVKMMEGKYSTINPRFDSLNKDSYSIYSLLLLIYSWGSSCMELDIQGDSIYETNLADLSRAHIMLSLHCSRCLPQNPLPEPIDLGEGGDFVLQAAQQALIYSMVGPWIRGLPINEILLGITVVSLLQKIFPSLIIQNTYAFKASEGYWVIIWNEANSSSFKGYIMVTANCGDSLAHLFVRYDTPFEFSLGCIDIGELAPSLPTAFTITQQQRFDYSDYGLARYTRVESWYDVNGFTDAFINSRVAWFKRDPNNLFPDKVVTVTIGTAWIKEGSVKSYSDIRWTGWYAIPWDGNGPQKSWWRRTEGFTWNYPGQPTQEPLSTESYIDWPLDGTYPAGYPF
jgi:hypothetical protein